MDKSKEDCEQQLYEEVFVPVIVAFARWVVENAVKNGKKRLYFLARDAYQPYLAARRIVQVRRLPIECRYLQGSRYAWRLPEYHLMGEIAADRLCTGGIDVTLRKILRRGGLTEEEVRKVACELYMEEELDRVRSYQDTRALVPVLRGSRYLIPYIGTHSRAAYKAAIAYFRQEGLFEKIPYAIVDSGWTGTVQQTLKKLLESEEPGSGERLEGYYFGLYELPEEADSETYHTFFFAPYGDIRKKVRFSNCLFEAVVSDPRGMTIGYEQKCGVWKSIRETRENPNRERIEKNLRYLEKSISRGEGFQPALSVYGSTVVCERLLALMAHPSKKEAEIFGSYLFSDDVWSTQLQPVARKLTGRDLREHHVWNRVFQMKGMRKGMRKDSAWIEGSIVNNGTHTTWNLWQSRRYKELVYLRKQVSVRKRKESEKNRRRESHEARK